MNLGDAVLKLTTDNTDLDKGLDKASKDAVAKGKEIGAAFTAAFSAALGFSAVLVKAWGEAEDAGTRLAAAIRSTGQAGKISTQSMEEFASQIQRTTRFEDDAAMAAMAALVSIGKFTEEGVKRALPVLADYAAATGTDLVTAAQQMAQAIEGGRNIFVRFGAETKDGMTKTEKFDEILRALNVSFKGTAEELRNNTIGQLTSLKNLFGDLAESGGRALSIVFKPFLELITPIVQKLADFANRTFTMSDALDAVKKGTADASQRLLVFADMLDIAKKKQKALTDEMTKAYEAGETLTFGDYRDLEKINDEVKQLTKLLEQAKQELKDAKGDKPTVIANVGDEDDVAALAKLNQSLDDMTNRYQAMGKAFQAAKWERGIQDMADRWVAVGQAVQAVGDIQDVYADKQAAYQASWDIYCADAIRDEKAKVAAVKQATAEIAAARDAELAAEKARLSLITSLTISSFKEIFQSTTTALVQGTLTWKSFGETVLKVLGKIISTMGDELAASAAADIVKAVAALASIVGAPAAPGFFASAAIKGAGAAAAWISGAALQAVKLKEGGEFTVPPGYENDSFPMRVQSGERVSVTPAGEGGGDMIHNTLVIDGSVLADWFTKASRNKRILTTARSVVP